MTNLNFLTQISAQQQMQNTEIKITDPRIKDFAYAGDLKIQLLEEVQTVFTGKMASNTNGTEINAAIQTILDNLDYKDSVKKNDPVVLLLNDFKADNTKQMARTGTTKALVQPGDIIDGIAPLLEKEKVDRAAAEEKHGKEQEAIKQGDLEDVTKATSVYFNGLKKTLGEKTANLKGIKLTLAVQSFIGTDSGTEVVFEEKRYTSAVGVKDLTIENLNSQISEKLKGIFESADNSKDQQYYLDQIESAKTAVLKELETAKVNGQYVKPSFTPEAGAHNIGGLKQYASLIENGIIDLSSEKQITKITNQLQKIVENNGGSLKVGDEKIPLNAADAAYIKRITTLAYNNDAQEIKGGVTLGNAASFIRTYADFADTDVSTGTRTQIDNIMENANKGKITEKLPEDLKKSMGIQ